MDPKFKDVKTETWIDRVYEPTRSELIGLRPTDDLWLHNGEHLTTIQRLGFLSFFIPFLGFGIGALILTVKLFLELNLAMLITGAIGAGLTYVSVRGIKNALQFKRHTSEEK